MKNNPYCKDLGNNFNFFVDFFSYTLEQGCTTCGRTTACVPKRIFAVAKKFYFKMHIVKAAH